MRCLPRQIPDSEVDQNITQRDQFNTDEFSIPDTLVREPHQNSLDGKSARSIDHVLTRIKLVEADAKHSQYWRSLLEPLRPHLEAAGLVSAGMDLSCPRILVIEDFGTTGLLGAIDKKDDLNFSDFWRRLGVSHKKGGAAGRWGLGKLVYSIASQIGTFFGLIIRDDDPSRHRLLMGQALLNTHMIDSVRYAPHIFLALVDSKNGIQIPEHSPEAVDAFCEAAGVSRSNEPGLSVVVPFPRPGLEPEHLLPHVISNYFFPILTGQLIVEIGDKTVDSAGFDELAQKYGGDGLKDGSLIRFIRSVDGIRNREPNIQLKMDWVKNGATGSLEEEQIEAARTTYRAGELVAFRAPLQLRRKSGAIEQTFVDVFLQKSLDVTKGQALFVRGTITIPGEARNFRGKRSFGAMIAGHPVIIEFLGDAENPSHTKWIGTAEKLAASWASPSDKISAIRRLLNDLNDLVMEAEAQVDELALIEFFSIPKSVESGKQRPKSAPIRVPVPDLPPPKPKAFSVQSRSGGFAIQGNPSSDVELPFQLKVVAAYDVRRGNPFTKYKRQDFDFRGATPIRTKGAGVSWEASESNTFILDVSSRNFRFEVSGFDTERDLELSVRR